MSVINGVDAEPGGRVELEFGPQGFAAGPRRRRSLTDVLEEWGERFFGAGVLLSAVGVALVFAGLAWVFGENGEPQPYLSGAGLVAFLYFLFGALLHLAAELLMWILVIGTLPLLILVPPYRRWLFGGKKVKVDKRPGYVHVSHVAHAWHVVRGDRVVVTVQFTNGAVVHYGVPAARGEELGRAFHALLGPRLARQH